MAGELTSFNEYEREFQSIASKLPGRITTVQGYAPAQEADANAELRKIEAEMTQARQRVRGLSLAGRYTGDARRCASWDVAHGSLVLSGCWRQLAGARQQLQPVSD